MSVILSDSTACNLCILMVADTFPFIDSPHRKHGDPDKRRLASARLPVDVDLMAFRLMLAGRTYYIESLYYVVLDQGLHTCLSHVILLKHSCIICCCYGISLSVWYGRRCLKIQRVENFSPSHRPFVVVTITHSHTNSKWPPFTLINPQRPPPLAPFTHQIPLGQFSNRFRRQWKRVMPKRVMGVPLGRIERRSHRLKSI